MTRRRYRCPTTNHSADNHPTSTCHLPNVIRRHYCHRHRHHRHHHHCHRYHHHPLQDRQNLFTQHCTFFLLLTYAVLPSVSNTLFRGLDCMHFKESGHDYLRVDTSVSCSLGSEDYVTLLSIAIPFIIMYPVAVPLVYAMLLVSNRKLINPGLRNDEASRRKRDREPKLKPLWFLIHDYRCDRWWSEIFDIARRIVMIGLLPFIEVKVRPMVGCGMAALSIIVFQEGQPFFDPVTNTLAEMGQWQLLVTYFMAFCLGTFEAESSRTRIAVFVLLVNVLIIIVTFSVGTYNHSHNKKNEEIIFKLRRELGNEKAKDKSKFDAGEYGGRWTTDDGRRAVGGGRWAMGNGPWAMGNGRWATGDGRRAAHTTILCHTWCQHSALAHSTPLLHDHPPTPPLHHYTASVGGFRNERTRRD